MLCVVCGVCVCVCVVCGRVWCVNVCCVCVCVWQRFVTYGTELTHTYGGTGRHCAVVMRKRQGSMGQWEE